MRTGQVGFQWLLRWVIWTVSAALGWLLASIVGMATIMASMIWDSDEVEAYLRVSLWERLSPVLWEGAIVGLILGAIIGLLQRFALHRRTRDAVLSALATIVGSMLFCTTFSILHSPFSTCR